MEANADGFTPFDAKENIQNVLNTEETLGGEGSGGTWRIVEENPLQVRERVRRSSAEGLGDVGIGGKWDQGKAQRMYLVGRGTWGSMGLQADRRAKPWFRVVGSYLAGLGLAVRRDNHFIGFCRRFRCVCSRLSRCATAARASSMLANPEYISRMLGTSLFSAFA